MRTANIRIRTHAEATKEMRVRFVAAAKTGKYQGEHFNFESPAALFRILTPRRWELVERLQHEGPLGVRALARALERDVKRVHEDVKALEAYGFIERADDGKLVVPFDEIRADFVLRAVA